jgi:hypothetical protein
MDNQGSPIKVEPVRPRITIKSPRRAGEEYEASLNTDELRRVYPNTPSISARSCRGRTESDAVARLIRAFNGEHAVGVPLLYRNQCDIVRQGGRW